MKCKAVVVMFLLMGAGWPQVSTARLHETLQECAARYGRPTETDVREGFGVAYWSVNSWRLEVSFVNSKAAGLVYRKVTSTNEPIELSKTEINELLDKNLGAQQWIEERAGVFFSRDGKQKALRLLNGQAFGVLDIVQMNEFGVLRQKKGTNLTQGL